MKYFYLILVTELLFLHIFGANEHKFYPNLPVGEYKFNAIAIVKCNEIQNGDIQFNLYINKRSRNISEIRGNITSKKPFDDSYTLEMNYAVKDSIGGWKDNAIIFKSPNSCSFMKKIMGDEWKTYLEKMGLNHTNCPIPAGTYVSKGYDLINIQRRSNFPKSFFYGTYKVHISLTDKNNEKSGCLIFVMNVLRPWENV